MTFAIGTKAIGGRLVGDRFGAAAEIVVLPVLAVVAALIVFGGFVALFGVNPLDLYGYMYRGAFGTFFSWQNTLTRAAPLILTSLCTALPAQLGMVVIGGEGALVMGGLFATAAGLAVLGAPPLVVQLVMAISGMARGRTVDRVRRRAAALSRRQRNHLDAAAELHRHRDLEPSGRRRDARPGQPQQAVELFDRRPEHDREHTVARGALGFGLRRRCRGPCLPPGIPHHVRLRRADFRRQSPRRQGRGFAGRQADPGDVLSRRRVRRALRAWSRSRRCRSAPTPIWRRVTAIPVS